MKFKRLVVLSDFHCGHMFGLTPEEWWLPTRNKLSTIQKEMYNWFVKEVKTLHPVDICLLNGDMIEGIGRKNSYELITTDIGIQVEMAIECIENVKAKKHIFTYGTPYHTYNNEDCEKRIASYFNAPIASEQSFEINGKIFNAKHHGSKSSIPHGQGTLIGKQALWNIINSQFEHSIKADFVIRSHIHEFFQSDNMMSFCISTPALQAKETIYGRSKVGVVHFGFIHFDIFEDGSFNFSKHIHLIEAQRHKIIKL